MKIKHSFTSFDTLPNNSQFFSIAQISGPVAKKLKINGIKSFIDCDDLGECEYFVFMLENNVTYILTSYKMHQNIIILDVNTNSIPIDLLLDDFIRYIDVPSEEIDVFIMPFEFNNPDKLKFHKN